MYCLDIPFPNSHVFFSSRQKSYHRTCHRNVENKRGTLELGLKMVPARYQSQYQTKQSSKLPNSKLPYFQLGEGSCWPNFCCWVQYRLNPNSHIFFWGMGCCLTFVVDFITTIWSAPEELAGTIIILDCSWIHKDSKTCRLSAQKVL